MGEMYVALVHYPVRDRAGQEITSAVTNIDVHDIARTCRTFGVKGLFIVTPIEAQRTLVDKILMHWCEGAGGKRIPERIEPLRRCHVVSSLADVDAHIQAETGTLPKKIVTGTAREGRIPVEFSEMAAELGRTQVPSLLLLGTSYGLADRVFDAGDVVLAPILGKEGFNHLSVRAAAAILLDRLLGAGAVGGA